MSHFTRLLILGTYLVQILVEAYLALILFPLVLLFPKATVEIYCEFVRILFTSLELTVLHYQRLRGKPCEDPV